MWDEAAHALPGLVMQRYLMHGDLLGFLRYVNHQCFYPPGYPAILALVFLAFGASVNTARIFSLFALFWSAICVYFLGKELSKDTGWLIGSIGATLTLTSPVLITWSAMAMLEPFGVLFTSLTLIFYLRALRTKAIPYYILTALGINMAFFTKYNYGVLSILALSISILIEARLKLQDVLSKENLLLAVCIVIPLVIWFISPYPNKIIGFLQFLGYVEDFTLLEHLLFYPRSLATQYSGSFAISLLLAFSLLASAPLIAKRVDIRTLFIFCWAPLIIATIHKHKQDRYIITIVPALYALAGYWVSRLFRRLKKANMPPIVMALLIISALSLASIGWAKLPSKMQEFKMLKMTSDASIADALDFISSTVKAEKRICIIGGFNEMSASSIAWHLLLRNENMLQPNIMTLPHLGQRTGTGMSPEMVAGYKAELYRVLDNSTVDYIITIEVDKESKFYTYDYESWNAWQLNYISLMEEQEEVPLLCAKSFSDGLLIKIYSNEGNACASK